MPRVSYTAPTTIDDAVKALAASAGLAKVLSGGTDLLVQLKSGRARPELIVDTKHIPGMIGIREEGDKIVIGAATPGVMISADERLIKAYPGIVEGVDLIGSTRPLGPPAGRSPTNAARSNTASRSPACSRGARPPSLLSAPRRAPNRLKFLETKE